MLQTHSHSFQECWDDLMVESLDYCTEDGKGEVTEQSQVGERAEVREGGKPGGNGNRCRILFHFSRANLSCSAGIRLTMSTPLLLDAVTHSSPPQAVTTPVIQLDSSNKNLTLKLKWDYI